MTVTGTSADPLAVLERVRALLGEDRARTNEDRAMAVPRTSEEVAALLRVAGENGWRVRPVGAGVEGRVAPCELVISTSGMTGVQEHQPADLMCRALAGTTLGSLQDTLAGEKQWLALDPPGGERVTLGGVVATGLPGPLQILYGRPRDQVLGLTLVDGEGRTLVLGGRVVKNVAGFDLVRLSAGSRGMLGVITEVTFRLYPIPALDRTLVWTWEDPGQAWTMGRMLAALPLPIAAAELLGGRWPAPMDDPFHRVAVRLLGAPAAVGRMADALMQVAGHPLRDLVGDESVESWSAISEGAAAEGVRFRLQSLPDRGGQVLGELRDVPLDRFALHLLTGTFRGVLRAGTGAGDLEPLGGQVTEGPGPVDRLKERIVRSFDPHGVLSQPLSEGVSA